MIGLAHVVDCPVTDLSALVDPRDQAEVHWSADRADRLALARRADWSGLTALEQLWPVLAERHGEALALDAPHAKPPEQLSFQALHSAILRAAAGFAALGVAPGDVVALFAENGPRWFLADQGLMRAGAADAVRGSGAPLAELSYILRDCGASALVVESAALLQKLTPQLLELADLKFVVLLEGASPAAGSLAIPCLGWDAFMELGATMPLPAPAPGGPERLATLLYTSGTTGEPKGVPLSHANLLHQLQTLGVAVAPHPGDRVLSVLPIWHAYERTAEYFLLACGCRQTYTNLKHFKADLQKVRPNYMISVPRLWEALLAGFEDALAAMPPARRRLLTAGLALSRFHCSHWRQAQDQTLASEPALARLAGGVLALVSWPGHRLAAALFWPKVRQQLAGGCLGTAISGGGALAPHVDGFFEAIGIELLVGYGLTETSPVLTCRRPWSNRRGSSGRPLPGTAIKVVDAEHGTPLGWGQRGRVLARGPQVMAGYYRKPEATAKAIDAEGWFDTGDLGHLLADGTLVLTGRAKDTIVLSSGENIEPGPLEEELAACALVEQVMVVGQDRRSLGALIVPRLEALAAYAQELGLPAPAPGADGAAPSADAALLKALTSRLNRRLAARPGARPDERLGGVALVAPFSIDNGLLTQTLKQRRDRISARDSAAIEAIYGR